MDIVLTLLILRIIQLVCSGQNGPVDCSGCLVHIDPAKTSGLSGAQSWLLFSAYTVTSEMSTNGLCSTETGSPVTLVTIFSVSSRPTADPAALAGSATSSFVVDYLGLTSCLYTLALATTLSASLSSVSSAATLNTISNTPPPNVPSTASEQGAKAAIAIGVVVFVIVVISLSIFLLWRHRKQKEGAKQREQDTQPYLQNKPELQDQETRKHELEATETGYEMDGSHTINELVGTEGIRQTFSPGQMQELRGEECSRELEADSR